MPTVFGGCYLCMCGNTLTVPHAPSLCLFCPTSTVSPLTMLTHAGEDSPSACVMCASARVSACACVSCVYLRACVCVRASLFWSTRVRVRICVCVSACVRACECLRLSLLSTICSQDPTTAKASLSQRRGLAHVCLGRDWKSSHMHAGTHTVAHTHIHVNKQETNAAGTSLLKQNKIYIPELRTYIYSCNRSCIMRSGTSWYVTIMLQKQNLKKSRNLPVSQISNLMAPFTPKGYVSTIPERSRRQRSDVS